MRPFASPDGHDVPRLIDEFVPSLAAMVDDVVVGCEDPVGKPVVTHELPDVFDRVQLGALWRQRDNGDVGRDFELVRRVPSGLIHQHDGMGTRRNRLRYFSQMQRHGFGVAERKHETGGLAVLGANGAEDVG